MTNNEVLKFDAIVIGTGISGGWAAKELCENGLKTLVLERGRMVEHIKDYPTANLDPWDFEHRGFSTPEQKKRQEKQARTDYTTPDSAHWFVDDIKHPYNEEKRFDWIRGYHVGGRSLMWYRMSWRIGDIDFEANKNDGYGVDWPIRYKDLEPWYDKVEEYIGVCGKRDGLPQLPDGKFTPPMELNCVEKIFQQKVAENFNDRQIINTRSANITGDKTYEGRSKCMYRNRCIRGCPFGGYFSSNASTLPAAKRTENMTLRPNSIAYEIIYDDKTKLATGVKIIDAISKEKIEFNANVVFCCASAIASTSILMQSKSERFPNGLGNDSGELGHNLMDHHFKVGASGEWDGNKDDYYKGRRPTNFYVGRFQNLNKETKNDNFLRGYGMQGSASRTDWRLGIGELSYGENLKDEMLKPGPWRIGMTCFGECLPYHENKISLDYDKLDEWGLPTVTFDCEFKENEDKMRDHAQKEAVKMLESSGFKNVKGYKNPCFPGIGIHEMGTARMGRDPKTSILNGNNQVHTVKNVYITDGAFMASSACQNPSLTYMAITARAANHAAEQLKKNKFKNV